MKLFLKLVRYLKKSLNKVERWLLKNEKNVNPHGFEDLAPINNVENCTSYLDALLFVLKNSDRIKNVAVTGPYGSGKSSIIKTFENEHPEYSFLNISLASFADGKNKESLYEDSDNDSGKIKGKDGNEEKEEKNNTKKLELNRLIELSILQQMFYKVKARKIPDSRFKRIFSLNPKRVIFRLIIFFIGLTTTVFIFNRDFFSRFSWWKSYYNSYADQLQYIFISLFLLILIPLFIYFLRLLNNSKFHKLNLTKGEIEIEPKSETSILNKHLDEILYFFEVAPFDVVVIEDLDRFENTEIFTKLRELNILINNSDQIKRNIVFIYSIKDDMFQDKTRTKFFDFIIPVIPVINTTTSADMMLKKIKGLSITGITDTFINNIALYIDDMRVLKNIFNEFLLYKEKLKAIGLNNEKLFGMIVYKNIYPDDFAKLHNDKGILYAIIKGKTTLIDNIVSHKKKTIVMLEEKINAINAITLKNIKELRSVYLFNLFERIPTTATLYLNGNQHSFSDINNDSLFEELTTKKNIVYYEYNQNNQLTQNKSGISFEDLEKTTDPTQKYKDRKELLEANDNERINLLRQNIEELNREISKIEAYSLRELIKLNEESITLLSEEFQKDLLLRHLIIDGYIDEMYHDYISCIYEDNLSIKDKIFLRSIKSSEPLYFNYSLGKIKELFRWLNLRDFERKEILNFDMVNFLFENRTGNTNGINYQKCYDLICIQLSNKKEISQKFIDEYTQIRPISKSLAKVISSNEFAKSISDNVEMRKNAELKHFIKSLCKNWNEFWDYISSESHYSIERKNEFLRLVIMSCDITELEKLNKKSSLSEFISNCIDFLLLFSENSYLAKIQEVIKVLNVKFICLNYSSRDREFLKYIYEYNYYAINAKMIELIIQTQSQLNNDDIQSLKTSNFTTIQQSKCDNLIRYINDNIETYVNDVFLNIETNTRETEDTVITLLNNDSISKEDKAKIIDKEEVQIENLTTVDRGLWVVLLQLNKVIVSWYNIVQYYIYSGEEIDKILDDYINQREVFKELFQVSFVDRNNPNPILLVNMSLALILNPSISDESFEHIINNLPCHLSHGNVDFQDLPTSRIDALINLKIIALTPENFSHLKELSDYSKGKYVTLIEKNMDNYIPFIGQYNIDSEGYVKLLQSSNITPEEKLKIILSIPKEVIAQSVELANLMCSILLENSYPIADIELLEQILLHGDSIENKINLLIANINDIDHKMIERLLNALRGEYPKIMRSSRNVTIPNSKINKSLIEKLQSIGFITNYKEEKEGITINFDYDVTSIQYLGWDNEKMEVSFEKLQCNWEKNGEIETLTVLDPILKYVSKETKELPQNNAIEYLNSETDKWSATCHANLVGDVVSFKFMHTNKVTNQPPHPEDFIMFLDWDKKMCKVAIKQMTISKDSDKTIWFIRQILP